MTVKDFLLKSSAIDFKSYEALINRRDKLQNSLNRIQSKIYNEEDSMSVFSEQEKADKDPRFMKHFEIHKRLSEAYKYCNCELNNVIEEISEVQKG